MTKEISQLATLVKYHPDLVIEEVKKHPDLVLQDSPIDQRSLLHVAAGHGVFGLVELLLQLGADVNKVDKFGETPIFRSIRFRMDEVTMLLIANGADVNARDMKLQTPLHRACAMGTARIVKKLIELQCDPSALDIDGKTPYDLGSQSKFASKEIPYWREELLDYMINEATRYNATENTDVNYDISELAQYIVNEPEKAPEYIARNPKLIQLARNSSNRTALHIACGYGRKETVEKLLETGLGINELDKFGQSPIFRAVEFKHAEIVELLIKSGAKLDIQDNKKRTVLHYACRTDNTPIIRLLLENKCDATLPEQDGLLPLDFALKYGVDPSDWDHLIESEATERSNKRLKPNHGQSIEQETELQTQMDMLEHELFSSQESKDDAGCTTEDGHWAINEYTRKIDDWLYDNNLVHKVGDKDMMNESKCWIVYIKALDVFLIMLLF
ncbi:hypothetical protein HDV04_002891 [Boothiomyces sp. JEL0838]|nr:hypothetical protein HDV04_002891 [Boothiomyces sp. JEL0838]